MLGQRPRLPPYEEAARGDKDGGAGVLGQRPRLPPYDEAARGDKDGGAGVEGYGKHLPLYELVARGGMDGGAVSIASAVAELKQPVRGSADGRAGCEFPRRRARGCRAGKSVWRSTAPARRCPGPPSGVRLTPVAQVIAAVNAVGQAGAALGFNAAEVCCMVGGISC